MKQQLSEELSSGIQQLGIAVPAELQNKLIDYIELLAKWNRTHNLTAIRDVADMVRRHLLDSLSISEYIDSDSMLDVGSGAGLPGIPIGIIKPHVNVTLVDSVEKKTRFMQYVAADLGLKNISVLHRRVEDIPDQTGYPVIVARAFSSVDKLCRLTAHLVAPGGKILAMIGRPLDTDSSKSLNLSGFSIVKEEKLLVPGETAERNIVVLRHSA
ncbi:hypothetical protein AB833_16340 [Chromatiales bacterium (ex Bugula neritina AB1)]|nr:hypothetical protein AB833_16340 [Chromatiales bacterium (ex Bugula neritina AB1)]